MLTLLLVVGHAVVPFMNAHLNGKSSEVVCFDLKF